MEAVNSFLTIDEEIAAFDLRGLSKYDYESYFAGCNSVGFEEGYVTYEMYKAYLVTYRVDNLVETEHLIEINRFVKDEEEIDNCKKACLITDKAFEHIKEFIRPRTNGKRDCPRTRKIYENERSRKPSLRHNRSLRSKFIHATCCSNR